MSRGNGTAMFDFDLNSGVWVKKNQDYYQMVHDKAIEGLSPEGVKMFDFWWNGGIIQDWEKFWTEHPKAYSATLWACGQGCG